MTEQINHPIKHIRQLIAEQKEHPTKEALERQLEKNLIGGLEIIAQNRMGLDAMSELCLEISTLDNRLKGIIFRTVRELFGRSTEEREPPFSCNKIDADYVVCMINQFGHSDANLFLSSFGKWFVGYAPIKVIVGILNGPMADKKGNLQQLARCVLAEADLDMDNAISFLEATGKKRGDVEQGILETVITHSPGMHPTIDMMKINAAYKLLDGERIAERFLDALETTCLAKIEDFLTGKQSAYTTDQDAFSIATIEFSRNGNEAFKAFDINKQVDDSGKIARNLWLLSYLSSFDDEGKTYSELSPLSAKNLLFSLKKLQKGYTIQMTTGDRQARNNIESYLADIYLDEESMAQLASKLETIALTKESTSSRTCRKGI